jgi:hypothetical protein
MGRKISLRMLENAGACEDGQEAFVQVFGQETVFSPTEEIVDKLMSNGYLDIAWAASRLTSFTSREWEDRVKPLRRKVWDEEDAKSKDDAAGAKFYHDRALEFLKLYEEYGIGEKVEESIVEDMTGHAGPFDVPPDDDPAETELRDQVNN